MKQKLYEIAKTGFFLLVTFSVVTGALLVGRAELEYLNWQERVDSVEQVEAVNMQILRAYEYNQEVTATLRVLANENGLLCEREVRTLKYVCGMEEANAKLRSSLADAVDRLEAQQEELNDTYDQVFRLQYRLEVLEQALKLIPTPADPKTQDNAFDDILSFQDLADVITRILPIILL